MSLIEIEVPENITFSAAERKKEEGTRETEKETLCKHCKTNQWIAPDSDYKFQNCRVKTCFDIMKNRNSEISCFARSFFYCNFLSGHTTCTRHMHARHTGTGMSLMSRWATAIKLNYPGVKQILSAALFCRSGWQGFGCVRGQNHFCGHCHTNNKQKREMKDGQTARHVFGG